jgi:hypothetical protein
MNERIKELITRLEPDAFMTYKGYLYHSSDPKVSEHSDPEPLYTQQELEKFAELIVRECVLDLKESHNREYGLSEAIERLEQHFGVEE